MSGGLPPAHEPSVKLVAGLVVAERFRLVRPLGEGGMGAVWVAQHVELDTPCALKFMHPEAARSPETAARFRREARAVAHLRSPHVVQILDHGVWRGTPYIAMELLEGEDLAKRLKRVRPMPPRDVARIAGEIGRALTKAHAAGLVHRDLKPANIFLVRDDDREIAKVLDFGVAKLTPGSALDEAPTTTGEVLGTPFYMSPEQLRGGRDVDHRSDLWALAVLVYQCLTGRLPFKAGVLAELIVKIMVDPSPVPSQVAPEVGLPPELDAWWARASERDPTRRFQTARELCDALTLALGASIAPSLGMSHGGGSLAPDSMAGRWTGRLAETTGAVGGASVEELDSGLLLTAMPTVGPTAPPGALQPVLPADLRPKRWVRGLVAAAALLVGGGAAVFALRGSATPRERDESPPQVVAASPSSPAAATAEPRTPASAAPAVGTSAAPAVVPTASASTAPPVKPAQRRPTEEPAKPPPPPVKRPPKHEGITDF
jgi:serine/threonine-protein kinase